jgi:fatty-acyl-CoA synthase
MKNSPAFLELTFAISHLGAVSLPLNYRLAAEEVGYIIDNAGARLLLCDEELAAAAVDLGRSCVLRRRRRGTADGWPPLRKRVPRCTPRLPMICSV